MLIAAASEVATELNLIWQGHGGVSKDFPCRKVRDVSKLTRVGETALRCKEVVVICVADYVDPRSSYKHVHVFQCVLINTEEFNVDVVLGTVLHLEQVQIRNSQSARAGRNIV